MTCTCEAGSSTLTHHLEGCCQVLFFAIAGHFACWSGAGPRRDRQHCCARHSQRVWRQSAWRSAPGSRFRARPLVCVQPVLLVGGLQRLRRTGRLRCSQWGSRQLGILHAGESMLARHFLICDGMSATYFVISTAGHCSRAHMGRLRTLVSICRVLGKQLYAGGDEKEDYDGTRFEYAKHSFATEDGLAQVQYYVARLCLLLFNFFVFCAVDMSAPLTAWHCRRARAGWPPASSGAHGAAQAWPSARRASWSAWHAWAWASWNPLSAWPSWRKCCGLPGRPYAALSTNKRFLSVRVTVTCINASRAIRVALVYRKQQDKSSGGQVPLGTVG